MKWMKHAWFLFLTDLQWWRPSILYAVGFRSRMYPMHCGLCVIVFNGFLRFRGQKRTGFFHRCQSPFFRVLALELLNCLILRELRTDSERILPAFFISAPVVLDWFSKRPGLFYFPQNQTHIVREGNHYDRSRNLLWHKFWRLATRRSCAHGTEIKQMWTSQLSIFLHLDEIPRSFSLWVDNRRQLC